jgi:hypothetical protein
MEIGPGAHSASYSIGTGFFPPEVKRMEREVNHSSPPGAEVKNEWRYTATPTIGNSWRGQGQLKGRQASRGLKIRFLVFSIFK